MQHTFQSAAAALVLIGAAALLGTPASANSLDSEGYFGGSWSSIGPGNYAERSGTGRIGPLYEGPHVYAGGPGYSSLPPTDPSVSPYSGYEYGPGIAPSYRVD